MIIFALIGDKTIVLSFDRKERSISFDVGEVYDAELLIALRQILGLLQVDDDVSCCASFEQISFLVRESTTKITYEKNGSGVRARGGEYFSATLQEYLFDVITLLEHRQAHHAALPDVRP